MIQVYNDAMAAEPEDMSLLYYLWYLKSGDGVLRVAAIEDAGQERKFIGGSQQISNRIKDKLGDRVKKRFLSFYAAINIVCLWGKVNNFE